MYWVKEITIFSEKDSKPYTYLLCDSFDEFFNDTAGILSAPVVFDAQIGRLPREKARANSAKEGIERPNWINNSHLSSNVISVMNELGAVISTTVAGTFTGIGEEHLGPQIKDLIINKKDGEKFYTAHVFIPGYESIFDGTINKKSQNVVENDLIYAYYINKDYDNAIKNYTQAIKIGANNAVACYNRGWNYHLNGNYDKAIEDLIQAKKIDPYNKNIDKMLQIVQKRSKK
jgi:tetratricopeptide (TPR) repeat protein